ncbi:MAG TPA: DEAD/DEAH box helicase family protein [Kofleriaceae bacterium]
MRPYERSAVSGILASRDGYRSTLLVLATGLGKTVVFAAVARLRVDRGRRICVLAHRTEPADPGGGETSRSQHGPGARKPREPLQAGHGPRG